MIINVLLICIGGFLGAICRYKLSLLLNSQLSDKIPLGTLFVNLLGSFLLGFIIGINESDHIHFLLGTGFMGAFTTFSTFNLEAVKLMQANKKVKAITYLSLTYVLGITLAFFGFIIGNL
ncbi:fluoride efflux transporter CrcB [Bacillus sp. DTU_2020_1000418_1_SI_GHA_SEK_038]|uniref:fluoride efflux transporter CrcB n=1 Tax=Bacillus sp. DTU_2020_1000418_1_SI_GHA_SEK_038 TaxID=3077585 RepID=UPI0028E5A62F|nr:fluoride efflux transporter CrcB [Bacillus sp. DTU_2020_1000418_1_SI_GHA_SEK_038]WNS73515.1 fluoride efflux transporter CrcB [Bacillus sp. DTU_2020_1000418_1_SI_GHA_SEK_038]